jgi:hypothetical protein
MASPFALGVQVLKGPTEFTTLAAFAGRHRVDKEYRVGNAPTNRASDWMKYIYFIR